MMIFIMMIIIIEGKIKMKKKIKKFSFSNLFLFLVSLFHDDNNATFNNNTLRFIETLGVSSDL